MHGSPGISSPVEDHLDFSRFDDPVPGHAVFHFDRKLVLCSGNKLPLPIDKQPHRHSTEPRQPCHNGLGFSFTFTPKAAADVHSNHMDFRLRHLERFCNLMLDLGDGARSAPKRQAAVGLRPCHGAMGFNRGMLRSRGPKRVLDNQIRL